MGLAANIKCENYTGTFPSYSIRSIGVWYSRHTINTSAVDFYRSNWATGSNEHWAGTTSERSTCFQRLSACIQRFIVIAFSLPDYIQSESNTKHFKKLLKNLPAVHIVILILLFLLLFVATWNVRWSIFRWTINLDDDDDIGTFPDCTVLDYIGQSH